MAICEMEPGWLDRQLRSVAADVRTWPDWMRRVAGLEPKRRKQLQCCHALCDKPAEFELFSDDQRLSTGACSLHLPEMIDDKVNTVWRVPNEE